MGRIVLKKAVERKPGYLYYVDSDGNVCEAKMARGGKKKKKKSAAKKSTAKKSTAKKSTARKSTAKKKKKK